RCLRSRPRGVARIRSGSPKKCRFRRSGALGGLGGLYPGTCLLSPRRRCLVSKRPSHLGLDGALIPSVTESGCGGIWQTRTVQVRVGASPWRFKSSHPHQPQAQPRRSYHRPTDMSEPPPTPDDRAQSPLWPERMFRVAVFVLPLIVALSAGLAVWAHSRAGKGGSLDLSTIEYVARPVVDQRPAPTFSVSSLNGSGRVSLRQYEGRIVVVNLWASWCGPCRKEAPALKQVWEHYREGGAMFVGIDHQDTKSDGLAFAREFGL